MRNYGYVQIHPFLAGSVTKLPLLKVEGGADHGAQLAYDSVRNLSGEARGPAGLIVVDQLRKDKNHPVDRVACESYQYRRATKCRPVTCACSIVAYLGAIVPTSKGLSCKPLIDLVLVPPYSLRAQSPG